MEDDQKQKLYLVDMTTVPGNLQRIIEREDIAHTEIYCFCSQQAPKISLSLLKKYSEWLQGNKLHIVQPPTIPQLAAPEDNEGSVIAQTLAYWIGKLTTIHPAATTRVFVASDDTALYNLVLWLRHDGYEVESSWPDAQSVECTDEILCTVLKIVQQTDSPLPNELGKFMQFLRNECKLPPYVSLESVVREMQQRGFITLHRGSLNYDLPIFLDALSDATPPHPAATRHPPHGSSAAAQGTPCPPGFSRSGGQAFFVVSDSAANGDLPSPPPRERQHRSRRRHYRQ